MSTGYYMYTYVRDDFLTLTATSSIEQNGKHKAVSLLKILCSDFSSTAATEIIASSSVDVSLLRSHRKILPPIFDRTTQQFIRR